MKLFTEQTDESILIKCLECRLVGKPPKFNMPPPPMPPIEILQQLDINIDDLILNNKNKKCMNKLNLFETVDNINNENSNLVQSSASTLVTGATPFLLTSTQSFYIFIACLLVFFIVLFVAFLFLIKLYHIKKQLDERANASKSTSDLIKSNRQHIFNCLSSSLTSSSASSTTSSNTINSNLILTPSNYITDSKSDTKSTDMPLIYNQLFSYNNSNGSYYLQSIPSNTSNNQTKLHNLDEYAEINSQTYNRNIIYNQYDPRVQSVLNSNSSSSIDSNSCHLAPLIQNNRALLTNQNGLIFLNPTLVNTNDSKSYFVY